jgi:hypothetical protein
VELTGFNLFLLAALVFVAAALYSSVGHGGASAYLAVMALLSVPVNQAATASLVLNILVAGVAALTYIKSGNLKASLLLPVLAASFPFALIGGWLDVQTGHLELLLGAALAFAAFRIAFLHYFGGEDILKPVRWPVLTASAGVVGLISGIIGIGGGIFLSPLLVLTCWARVNQAAAISSVFIVVNSMAGLLGRVFASRLDFGTFWPLLPFAMLGAILGARFGAKVAGVKTLRLLLAAVMLASAVKLLLP